MLLPTADDAGLRRVAEGIARELHASVHGFTFALGHSRVAHDPVDLYRAGNEALLAANVATAGLLERRRRDARVRGHRRLPAAAARDERGPGGAAALLRGDGRAARRLRRPVRDRPRADARDLPGRRRQRRRHRRPPVHAPPHRPLPARAREGPDGARRRLHRRPREARPRSEGDARARHRRPARPGHARPAPAAGASSARPRIASAYSGRRGHHGPAAHHQRPADDSGSGRSSAGRTCRRPLHTVARGAAIFRHPGDRPWAPRVSTCETWVSRQRCISAPPPS